MQDEKKNSINTSVKLIIILLLFVSIIISKSFYLLVCFFIYFIFLLILTDKSVKPYINLIKNLKFVLLFVFLIYIIIIDNIGNSIILVYKIILILLYIRLFTINIYINDMLDGIVSLFKPIDKLINTNILAYRIFIFFTFLEYYIDSYEEIFKNYDTTQKIIYAFSIKYNVLPRLALTVFKINNLESNIKLKFIKPKYEILNKKSKIVLIIVALLFLLVLLKEVIF